MKRLICVLACIVLVMNTSACAPSATITQAESTPPAPAPAPTPTPEPKAGVRYDLHREYVTCHINEEKRDTKEIWKVKSPTESPDPAWTVEATDGDIVTYSKIYCDHVLNTKIEVPCEANPDEMDYYMLRVMPEEVYNSKFNKNYLEVLSIEDGIVTCVDRSITCDLTHTLIKYSEIVPCQLCEGSPYQDVKEYVKVHSSISQTFIGWELEEVDGEWTTYSMITECTNAHKAYAALYEQEEADTANGE